MDSPKETNNTIISSPPASPLVEVSSPDLPLAMSTEENSLSLPSVPPPYVPPYSPPYLSSSILPSPSPDFLLPTPVLEGDELIDQKGNKWVLSVTAESTVAHAVVHFPYGTPPNVRSCMSAFFVSNLSFANKVTTSLSDNNTLLFYCLDPLDVKEMSTLLFDNLPEVASMLN